MHDFVRDAVRNTVLKARPAASFLQALSFGDPAGPDTPQAGDSLLDGRGDGIDMDPILRGPGPGSDAPWSEHQIRDAMTAEDRDREARELARVSDTVDAADTESFTLTERRTAPMPGRLAFSDGMRLGDSPDPLLGSESAGSVAAFNGSDTPPARSGQPGNHPLPDALPDAHCRTHLPPGTLATTPVAERIEDTANLHGLAGLRPLGQVQDSFILAVNEEGLWIIDQHVAHERILFEKVLRERQTERVQRQRLLMPLLIDLVPAQMANFAGMAAELARNGFEAEPFGPRTLAVKAAPVGLEGRGLELTLAELLQVEDDAAQADNMDVRRRRIAASIACHAAVKIHMPLEMSKMQWLLDELGKTENPMACPHGRPIALRYSHRDIQRAFQRI